ncbi:MAG: proteasome subunit beta [Candidatus Woesearchaeota archaeon]
MLDAQHMLKTGTTTVGVIYKDGVVLAADKRATAGSMIADKRALKVHKITDKIAVSIAGTVSDIQLLVKLLRAELALKELRTQRSMTVKEVANLLSGMVYQNIRKMSLIPGVSHFLVGGVDDSGKHLYDLFADGSLSEIEDFVSSGSGSVFAFGVLESLYENGMEEEKAVELAEKALMAALKRDAMSGNGIDMIVVSETKDTRMIEKKITL